MRLRWALGYGASLSWALCGANQGPMPMVLTLLKWDKHFLSVGLKQTHLFEAGIFAFPNDQMIVNCNA